MAFVRIPNCWRASMVFQTTPTGLLAVNTLGILDTGTHDADSANAVAAALVGWWDDQLKGFSSHSWSLTGVNVLDQDSATGPSIEYDTGLPLAGTDSGAAAPANAAPIVTFRSASRGRSYRGRNYIIGATDGFTGTEGGGAVDADVQAAYLTAYQALPDAIEAVSDCSHVVLSRVLGLGVPVTGYAVRSYLGTQRRRVTAP
jgi:hypothetical protein